jgi:hypothetical protein
MPKRLTWMTVGFGLGVGATVTTARKLRKRVERYQPKAVGDRVVHAASSLRDALAAAVAEGREAAVRREADLRARHLDR